MFGIGADGLIDSAARYYLSGSAVILVIAAVFAFPAVTKAANNTLRRSKTPAYLSVIFFGALLLLCIAGIMSGTYSSFLYFQF